MLILPPQGFTAGEFDLHISDVSGLDQPWPLIGGLPFPEGELRDASQIRIVDGEDREVAAQIDVSATWRDGSIRWVLAGFTANPQGKYRVEFGDGVTRSEPERPLRIEQTADRLTIDTGAAVYEFLPDRLLPETAHMGDVAVLADAGNGAYLVDNQGRLARVAGALAEIETEILKQGPMRAVIRREGWYVTDAGERVARAKAWFYFAAGSPYLKITHSLIFTEDTNRLWLRDYGLAFGTPAAPAQVMFSHREAEEAEKANALGGKAAWDNLSDDQRQAFAQLLSGTKARNWELSSVTPADEEVYLLQDIYPHLLERDFRAVIGRGNRQDMNLGGANFWQEPWEWHMDVAGDWGDALYARHGLTVVMPQLAQQFPKEIAFGPDHARVAFWSGRSGRELDFRAVTLMNEFWQEWATGTHVGRPRAPGGPMALAAHPSNASGAARTHDIWLLPRSLGDDSRIIQARARAASHPPLLHADPRRLSSSGAVGWPVSPRNPQRFPEAELMLDAYWSAVMQSYVQLRLTGFFEWGRNHTLRHARAPFFRISRLTDYGLGRYVWALFGRSGERGYWEYGSRFNRFVGDWELANWTTDEKLKGCFVTGDNNLPFHWGESTYQGIIRCEFDITGQTVLPWLLEYYLTGDEQVLELTRMVEDAYRKHWDFMIKSYSTSDLHALSLLYSREWDNALGDMARQRAEQCIDLDCPVGIDDQKRHGVLYKLGTDLLPIYEYYQTTGDPLARKAFLQGVDYMYRFGDRPHARGHLTAAMGGQNYVGILFAIAYRMTGNANYLRVVNDQIQQGIEQATNITGSVHGAQRGYDCAPGLGCPGHPACQPARLMIDNKLCLLNEKMDELVRDLQAESLVDLSGLSVEEIAS
ncbi:MAG: hypothetical protein LC725_10070 [Lentisphaerae bacterium]|nr:hypothetical protein [Lentisphaerota bacterium]